MCRPSCGNLDKIEKSTRLSGRVFSAERKLTFMSIETDVLRTLLRLAHRRTGPTLDLLVERVGSDERAVRRALFSLARSGLVQRTQSGLRLTLPGLAVAAAADALPRPKARAKALPLSRSSRRPRRAA